MATKAQNNDTAEPNAGTQQEQPQESTTHAAEGKQRADVLAAFYAGTFTKGFTVRFETRGGETNAIVEKV